MNHLRRNRREEYNIRFIYEIFYGYGEYILLDILEIKFEQI